MVDVAMGIKDFYLLFGHLFNENEKIWPLKSCKSLMLDLFNNCAKKLQNISTK